MYVSSSCVFDLKRKSVLKLLDRTVYPQTTSTTAPVNPLTGLD